MYGRLVAAQFVADLFGLTIEDARARNCEALRLASTDGHLEVVRWLVGEFGLTAKDIHASGAVRHAIKHEHHDVAQWLSAAAGFAAAT